MRKHLFGFSDQFSRKHLAVGGWLMQWRRRRGRGTCRVRHAHGLGRCGRCQCGHGSAAGPCSAGVGHGPDSGGLGPGDLRLKNRLGAVLHHPDRGGPVAELHPCASTRRPSPFGLHPDVQLHGDVISPIETSWSAALAAARKKPPPLAGAGDRRGSNQPRRAALIRPRSLRLKPKAAPAPRMGRGPGTALKVLV